MVAVAAEAPIRADAVPAVAAAAAAAAAPDAAPGERADAAAAVEAEAAEGVAAGKDGGEEVREYKSDARKLEELFKKLNPSAEEFVPLARRRGGGDGARRLSADAPVFVSPAIDFYSQHPVQQPPPIQVLPVVVGGGGGAGLDSSSDGSTNGQPNRRRRSSFNQGRRRMGGRPRRTDREDSVRRTVYVSDIDQHVTEQKLAEVFSNCGQTQSH
uniref:Ataxin-2 C-terminal domain-containing protein n=1 Tax=Oryza meridionalis TaxID=40149 RepID=A0A0E0DWL1_9ORYZ